jgi:hypothetical protein
MNQAVKNSPAGKVPLVIVHELNQRFDKALVMIRMKDWEDFYGRFSRKDDNG